MRAEFCGAMEGASDVFLGNAGQRTNGMNRPHMAENLKEKRRGGESVESAESAERPQEAAGRTAYRSALLLVYAIAQPAEA